jgi:hypothetical protein
VRRYSVTARVRPCRRAPAAEGSVIGASVSADAVGAAAAAAADACAAAAHTAHEALGVSAQLVRQAQWRREHSAQPEWRDETWKESWVSLARCLGVDDPGMLEHACKQVAVAVPGSWGGAGPQQQQQQQQVAEEGWVDLDGTDVPEQLTQGRARMRPGKEKRLADRRLSAGQLAYLRGVSVETRREAQDRAGSSGGRKVGARRSLHGGAAVHCCICMSETLSKPLTLRCGHDFHSSCVARWLAQRPVCPVCNARVHIPNRGECEAAARRCPTATAGVAHRRPPGRTVTRGVPAVGEFVTHFGEGVLGISFDELWPVVKTVASDSAVAQMEPRLVPGCRLLRMHGKSMEVVGWEEAVRMMRRRPVELVWSMPTCASHLRHSPY